MHAKPDLRVFLKWMIARSGSVITDVIPLNQHANSFGSSSRCCVAPRFNDCGSCDLSERVDRNTGNAPDILLAEWRHFLLGAVFRLAGH